VAGAHGWQRYIGRNWHDSARASRVYTIALEDGHVTEAHGWQRHIGNEKLA
jgi:hypothetical protein